MADCLINPVQQIWTQCVWPFLKPHVDYWWDFNSNIQGLRQKVRDLEQKIRDLYKKVEVARFDIETRARIQDWSKPALERLEEGKRILRDDNIPAWNITSRYSMGKMAKTTAEAIEILIKEGEFNTTADPAPQPAMKYTHHGQIVDIESRKSIEKVIIHSLQKSSVYVIGIWGMGGVGKTIMARRIEERVKEEKLFDVVVNVTVSQTVDVPKIQNEIAHSLKLEFGESNRAEQLRQRLMDAQRKLIICDDVWESLDFEELGFPIECKSSNFESCKVLLTSRSKNTYKTIKKKAVFNLKNLGEREAWNLFKDKAGICDEPSDEDEGSDDYGSVAKLVEKARLVAKECKGLPLALVTLGIALNGAEIEILEHSLSEFKRSNPKDLTGVLKNVYKALRLSYDFLEKYGEQELFLMCCLFPEDYDIPIQQLTWYRMGLELLTNIEEPNISTIEEARNQTYTWAKELQSRSLLIAGEDEHHVKMHDVMRDLAIHIGSSNGFLKSLRKSSIKNLSDDDCNWMSVDISNGQMEVPELSRFPNLHLLMLSSNLSSNQFSDISFEGIQNLDVLSFQNISIRSLPSTLANLQTLCLFHCGVEDISVIGKFTKLKILSCCECDNITELPKEIESLKALRLLELSYCPRLQTIPSGVISSLSPLEELKIRSSFSKWGTTGNASLTELDGLGNLTCFEIEISYCTLYLSQKLVRYTIFIHLGDVSFKISGHENIMNLKLLGGVGHWIQQLARKAESLMLRGDDSHHINLVEMENLSRLIFSDCSKVKKLVDTSHLNQNVLLNNLEFISIKRCSNLRHLFPVSVARTIIQQLEVLDIENCKSMEQVFWNEIKDNNTYGCIEFPKLKKLTLSYLPNLTAFCQGSKDVSFNNLKSIYITGCDNLRSLFSARSCLCLLQLKVLEIYQCKAMEQVFWNDGSTYGCIECPKLKELRLQNLPNLTAFCQGLENIVIKFPNLTQMKITNLSKLNSIFPHNSKDVSFCNLKFIEISGCDKLRYLFSVLVARRCLLQLEVLEIERCAAIEQVFWNEETDDNTDGCIEFSKLKDLRLRNLSSLTAFCQGLENIKFPNLTQMEIQDLPKLNSLFPLNAKDVSFTNLKSIYITGCDNLRSLFPARSCLCLLQLEVLKIYQCKAMEQVFLNDGITDGCIEFPKLKHLILRDLPNLTAFCQGLENIVIKFPSLIDMYIRGLPKLNSLFPLNSETVENTCFHLFCNPKDVSFGNLKSIDIRDCDNLRNLFSVSAARRCLLQLEVLEIHNCKAMKQVLWNEGTDDNTDGCIEFPKLKELKLFHLPNLTAFCLGLENITIPPNSKDISFSNLKSIYILGCYNLRSLFSARSCRFQFEVLEIENCEAMEQVFWNEGTYGCIEFPKLKGLRLQNLPNLRAFCQGLENIIIKFPNLTQMEIGRLPKLNSLCPLNSETVVWHNGNTCFHLFCNPKVEMNLLKNLTLDKFKDHINNIWCHQIPDKFFNNLEILRIICMNDIRSLVSTSIAKNLGSLKSLCISDCEEMVEVIEGDDNNDKQVVDINCLFPNLNSLDIRGMPKLIRFWQWNHALELPSLEEMNIHNCPVMETFTLGSVNTPNIRNICVNYKVTVDHKDLNDVIRHMGTKV